MIPALLIAPIDYEQFYASADGDDEAQRFAALSRVIERLEDENVGWLKDGIHSVHLVDWDWRSESRKYNHRHVPMKISTPEIFDWYREYGAFLQLAPSRANRFSFARFFFEVVSRRDVVVVRFDLTGEPLFRVNREGRENTKAEQTDDPGAAFTPETATIHVNRRRALEICRPLGNLLRAFRKHYPTTHRPVGIISLADIIDNLEEPVSSLLAASGEVKAAGDAYKALPEQPLEAMGDNPEGLLHGKDPLPAELAPSVTLQEIRVLLANITVHAYLLPETLQNSRIAIVPGVAQIEDGKPMAAGGFLLHYEGDDPCVPLQHWLLLATTWAREKAAFDLVERNRRQQLGKFVHNISNRFGGLIARVRALEPPGKSQAVAYEMEDMQGFMLAATSWVRGSARNTDHVYGYASDLLAGLLEDVLVSLAGNEDVLNNYFGRHVDYEFALSSVRDAVEERAMPEDLRTIPICLSRRLSREILGELIKNALEYTPWSAFPDGRIDVVYGSDRYGPYVDVTNPVASESLPKLVQIADALRRKRDPDVIGLGIKALTTLCGNEGLPSLRMIIDEHHLAVTLRCHLARMAGENQHSTDADWNHEDLPDGGRTS